MLSNLKDFLNVMQEGLTSNNNLRQKLQDVQKVRNIFKEKPVPSHSESSVNYGAGAELLAKYQSQWAELHENSEYNAKAAEDADKLISDIHEVTKSRLQSATELAQNMAHLPQLTAQVAECLDSLKKVQVLIKSVEEELAEFEDIVERSKMERWKLDHQYHLTLYKEKKMIALEETRYNLFKENSEHSVEKEKQHLAEVQARSAIAFQHDMSKYLSSGSLPAAPAPPPKMTLEQVQLEDDRTDLDKFLES